MKCWHCDTDLIWGGDHDIEEENFIMNPKQSTYSIVTNLSCPNCNSFVEVYYPREEEEK